MASQDAATKASAKTTDRTTTSTMGHLEAAGGGDESTLSGGDTRASGGDEVSLRGGTGVAWKTTLGGAFEGKGVAARASVAERAAPPSMRKVPPNPRAPGGAGVLDERATSTTGDAFPRGSRSSMRRVTGGG